MAEKPRAGKSGYEKYVNYKTFSIAVAAFVVLLCIPMPASMLDVAVEYSAGKDHVLDFYTQELFEKKLVRLDFLLLGLASLILFSLFLIVLSISDVLNGLTI